MIMVVVVLPNAEIEAGNEVDLMKNAKSVAIPSIFELDG